MSNTSSLVSELKSTADRFASGVSAEAQKVNVALDKIDKTVANVNQKIIDLREMIIEGEEKQLAHENVLKIEQQLNEQLKTYQVVRRSVLGVIKDFNINLARNSTVSKLSEELWMSSSRYWLSYALIAISAWAQNDREVCGNAVSEAMRRDPVKTSLFFCLLNLRFGRHREAREWMYDYFGSVDSAHPPRETALLLQAYLYGVFGNDYQLDEFVRGTVDKWVSELSADTEISSDLVASYNGYIESLPTEKVTLRSGVLGEYCENVDEMNASLSNAGRYKTALKRVEALDNVKRFDCSSDFIRSIDALLDDLVTNYDEEEIRLRNEQMFYKLVMEHEGDVEAAKKQYAAYMETVKDAPNIGKQMFKWAVYPEGEDETVQKFAMEKTKGWFKDAIEQYDGNIKSSAPAAFKLKIDLWEDTTDGKDREAVTKALENKFLAERSRLVVFTKSNLVLSIIAITALLVGCIIGMAANIIWGYIAGAGLFVIFVAVVVVTTALKMKAFPARIERGKSTLIACLDEIDAFRKIFEESAAVKDEVLQKLEYI